MIRLSYISFFTAPPQLTYILKTLTFGSSPPPSTTSCLRTNLSPRPMTFHSKVFLSHKQSLLLKIYDDVIFHVICELVPPQQKILATPMLEFNKFLCLVIFLFNQSKNNAVLESKTGHFQGLVRFEAKDLKICP